MTQNSTQIIPLDQELQKKIEEEDDILQTYIKLRFYLETKKYKSVKMFRAQKGYYGNPLNIRKIILGAPSEQYLCKSIILQNTAYRQENESQFYFKYVCVIIQYITKLNAESLTKVLREVQNNNCSDKIGKKGFHYRLVPDEVSQQLTGYKHNGVTPFLFSEPMPIVISQGIANLNPQFFWLGGGHEDMKIRISLQEFIDKSEYKVYIGDITDEKTDFEINED